MANTHTSLEALFSDIATQIRQKTGSSTKIIADKFPTAIQDISLGESPPSFAVSTVPYQVNDVAVGCSQSILVATGSGLKYTGNPTGSYTNASGTGSATAACDSAFSAIVAGGGVVIAVSNSGYICTSGSGRFYGQISVSGAWADIAYGDGRFMAVGSNNKIAYSDDYGTTWETIAYESSDNWKRIFHINGYFLIAGDKYLLKTKIRSGSAPSLYAVQEGASYTCLACGRIGTEFCCLAVTSNGVCYVSYNSGEDWTKTISLNVTCNFATYGNGWFVIAGKDCIIKLTSLYNYSKLSVSGTWNRIRYIGDSFVAMSSSKTVACLTDSFFGWK